MLNSRQNKYQFQIGILSTFFAKYCIKVSILYFTLQYIFVLDIDYLFCITLS